MWVDCHIPTVILLYGNLFKTLYAYKALNRPQKDLDIDLNGQFPQAYCLLGSFLTKTSGQYPVRPQAYARSRLSLVYLGII